MYTKLLATVSSADMYWLQGATLRLVLHFVILHFGCATNNYIDESSQNATEDEQRTINQMPRFVSLKTNVATGSTHTSPPRSITNWRRNIGQNNKVMLETNR